MPPTPPAPGVPGRVTPRNLCLYPCTLPGSLPLHAHVDICQLQDSACIPLLQEAFLGSLVRIKCPLSVFQRPWSLATEVVCPPVGFPYLTQPL